MLQLLFILILLGSLAGYLGLDLGLDLRVLGVPVFATASAQTGIPVGTIKNLLGIGVLFSEFVVILFTMLDRIGDTLKETIKPVVRLIPFGVFLAAAWDIFAPIILALLPSAVATAFNSPQMAITDAVNRDSFTPSLLLSLGAMVLFIIGNYALGRPKDSAEVQALRAENARLKKELRRGL
jgi:hypothetical protein